MTFKSGTKKNRPTFVHIEEALYMICLRLIITEYDLDLLSINLPNDL